MVEEALLRALPVKRNEWNPRIRPVFRDHRVDEAKSKGESNYLQREGNALERHTL